MVKKQQKKKTKKHAFTLDVSEVGDLSSKDGSSIGTEKLLQQAQSADDDDGQGSETGTRWGIIFIVLLLWAACTAALCYFAFQMTHEQENQEFEAKFIDFANEIIRSSVNNARNSHLVLESFSRTVTSLALYSNITWPLLTLPHYETRSNDYITITKAESITFAPIVPGSMREDYENYTVSNQQWIQQGIDYEYYHNNYHQQLLEEAAQQQGAVAVQVPESQSSQETVVNREGFSILNRAKPIQPFIWTYAPLTHRAVPDLSKGPYVPIWQTYPAPRNSFVVGNNLVAIPEFQQLLNYSYTKKATTLSDVFDNNFRLFGASQTIDIDPKSVLVQPIFRNIDIQGPANNHNNQIVAYMLVIKKWHQIFQDVLYGGAKPIDVVLRNTCDKAFTYRIIGSEAYFLGKGDLHDPRYSSAQLDMTVESPLFGEEEGFYSQNSIHSACHHTLHVYPTREMEDDYRNNLPIIVVATVLTFCVLLGFGLYLYNHMTQKNQRNKLRAQAQQQHAILTIDHARQAAASERQLNEFIAHEVRNPLAAAMSACSFVSSAVQDLNSLASSLTAPPPPPPPPPPKPLFGIAPSASTSSQQPAPLFAMAAPPASNTKTEQEQQHAKQVQEQKDSIMEDLHIIDSSLSFINELLRNMLDVQRATHHQLKINMAPTDILRDILEPVDAMLYRRGHSEVKVIIDCPYNDIMVMTDRLRLKQVVLNLSRNSIKFVERGYIKLKVVVVPVGDTKHVQIWVEDTGPGIPEEKKGRLFAKFQESLDSLSQGTGLGLSLVQILMSLLHGDVHLDETYDSGMEGWPGARFIIDLKTPPLEQEDDEEQFHDETEERLDGDIEAPVAVATQSLGAESLSRHSRDTATQYSTLTDVPEQAAGMLSTASGSRSLPQELKVLFVDDDTVLRKLFVRGVRRIAPAWKIQEAASGEAALRLIDEFNESESDEKDLFDLIFMDQYMASTQKQLLGTEATQALRSKGVTSKICGLSANDMANDFFAAGANAFVCKPLPAQKDILHGVLCDILFRTSACELARRPGDSALVVLPTVEPKATHRIETLATASNHTMSSLGDSSDSEPANNNPETVSVSYNKSATPPTVEESLLNVESVQPGANLRTSGTSFASQSVMVDC